jgi:CheY-like chemotaxis protein
VLDLNEVIDDTKKLVLRLIGEHIEVVSRLEVGLGGVMADPSQLTQILVNLAVNARDAMVDGGSLAVSTKNVRLSDAFAEGLGLDGGPYVVLSVADTGAGMDEQTMKRAFEPFFTTKPVGSGSGLGLSTVYGIAHQSGGAVAIESTLGRGTTVRVYLPRVDEPAQADVATGAPLAPAPGRGTVLLVEDEPVIRKLVASMLERQGYAVFTAGEPNEALALASELTEIDLLVTDVVMPGMNGPELAAQLVAGRPGLPVLFISGYPADAIAGRRLVPDSAAVLRKPFGANELFSAIATVVSA